MIHADYTLDGNDHYYFTADEWSSLVITGTVSASISIMCNILVFTLQSLMLFYRPGATNRLTLRLITVSGICNMIYCCLEISAIVILSTNKSCRALIYLIVTFDTMSSMSLAMIGLNLVMIFIFKIYRSWKAELSYYIILLLSGILVSIIPLRFGHGKDPSNLENSTCWYHFYFEDRFANAFDWMWYYGWLMLSLVFATAFAFLSIRYLVKNQEYLAGVLNICAQEEREAVSGQDFRKFSPSNTKIFLKIARRYTCYPLVPLFSKIWGVAVAIASARNKDIPFAIFIVDRVFSCLFGFMVACIYFSDPAIKNVIKETVASIKQTYVYNYYAIKYQPGFGPDGLTIDEKYLKELQIISLDKSSESVMEYFKKIKQYNIEDQQNTTIETSTPNLHHPLEITDTMHSTIPILDPPRVELEVVRGERINSTSQIHQRDRCCSLIALTCTDGKTVIPKCSISTPPKRGYSVSSSSNSNNNSKTNKKNKVSTVPMKRLSRLAAPSLVVKGRDRTSSIPEEEYTCHAEFVDTMVAFKHPKTAKFIHWCLISIFRVKPGISTTDLDKLEAQPEQRVFRDFTDSSNPQTPVLDNCNLEMLNVAEGSTKFAEQQPDFSEESQLEATAASIDSTESYDDSSVKNNKTITIKDDNITPFGSLGEKTSTTLINENTETVKRPGYHRSVSINIASLNREKLKLESPSASTKSKASLTTTQKIAASFNLRKLLDKSLTLSISGGKSTNDSESSVSISIKSKDEDDDDDDKKEEEEISVDSPSIENIPMKKQPVVKSLKTMEESEFAVELSPRPLKQYQNLPSKPSKKESHNSPKANGSSKIKTINVHDTSSFGTSSPIPNLSKPEPSKPSDSFKNISTSLNYISNWQFVNSKERITDTFEHWDLEQQLQDQMVNSKSNNQLS